jgi:hypothetical protein
MDTKEFANTQGEGFVLRAGATSIQPPRRIKPNGEGAPAQEIRVNRGPGLPPAGGVI